MRISKTTSSSSYKRTSERTKFFFLIARTTKSDVINHTVTSSWLVDCRAGKRQSTLRIIDWLSCLFPLVFFIVIYPGWRRKDFFERVLTKGLFSFAHREATPMLTFSLFGKKDEAIFHQTEKPPLPFKPRQRRNHSFNDSKNQRGILLRWKTRMFFNALRPDRSLSSVQQWVERQKQRSDRIDHTDLSTNAHFGEVSQRSVLTRWR